MEFLSPEEHVKLSEKLAALKANRPVLSRRIAEARALGDLKENADYHAAREDQAMEEADIKQLEARLKDASILDESQKLDDVVFVGSTVKLREVDSGDEDVYRLVGEATNDPTLEYFEVTPNSPMGEALMKARLGDVVRVDAPRKTMRFEVVEIL